MLETTLFASAVAAAGAIALWTYRTRHYRQLSNIQQSIAGGKAATQPIPLLLAGRAVPTFDERLAVLPNAIPADQFERLRAEIERLSRTERSYLPSHKKGGTVAYETLCQEAPEVVAFYLSPALHDLVSRVVGERVLPTPLHDQSSCSVLFYERPGDHIGWHYDHNFYKGRHFTVLLPIVNRDTSGHALSAARLYARIGREERQVPTPPNQMVIFEGARVVHKATPIGEGERRILLSMTFCADPRSSVVQGMARRIKDTAFFGIRALWT